MTHVGLQSLCSYTSDDDEDNHVESSADKSDDSCKDNAGDDNDNIGENTNSEHDPDELARELDDLMDALPDEPQRVSVRVANRREQTEKVRKTAKQQFDNYVEHGRGQAPIFQVRYDTTTREFFGRLRQNKDWVGLPEEWMTENGMNEYWVGTSIKKDRDKWLDIPVTASNKQIPVSNPTGSQLHGNDVMTMMR